MVEPLETAPVARYDLSHRTVVSIDGADDRWGNDSMVELARIHWGREALRLAYISQGLCGWMAAAILTLMPNAIYLLARVPRP